MKRLSVALLPLVLIGAIATGGCGTSTPSTPFIIMTSNNFNLQYLTIPAGTQVQLVDPAKSGGVHILCFGHEQTCTPNPNGPAELSTVHGIQFTPGDSKTFTVANPGTYEVTCTIHQHMNLTIGVHSRGQ